MELVYITAGCLGFTYKNNVLVLIDSLSIFFLPLMYLSLIFYLIFSKEDLNQPLIHSYITLALPVPLSARATSSALRNLGVSLRITEPQELQYSTDSKRNTSFSLTSDVGQPEAFPCQTVIRVKVDPDVVLRRNVGWWQG